MRIKIKSLAFVLIASIILACSAAGAVQVFSTTIPISFIANNGQTDEQVLYFADAAGYTLYLTAAGEVISTADPATAVQIAYLGSSQAVMVSGENKLTGKANFLIGNDKDKWVTDVPIYGSVMYAGLYDGVSVIYQGGVGTLKKEFIIEPGADPLKIQMKYTGQEGLALDDNGALLVTTAAGTFFETPPVCYQTVGDARVAVPCTFILGEDGIVTFSVGAYDMTLPLIIDPQYDFSTYLGGAQDDFGAGIGLDDAGYVYVVGSTQSMLFPLSNGPIYQEHLNGSWDIFAAKFDPIEPRGLVYSTYIGGYSDDLAGGMVVNNQTDEVTFTGSTKSWNYPAPLDHYGGNTDAIVTRLNANGDDLIWSRMIYGNKTDVGTAIARPYPYNSVVVAGYTSSTNLSSWGFPIATGPNGGVDGFVLIILADGSPYAGRYLGGSSNDYAYGVAVQQENSNPDIWVTGSTNSLAFPTAGPAFRNSNSGGTDAFVTRLNWDLTLDTSTYLGGFENDVGTAIAIDNNLCPYITGYTESPVSPMSLFPIRPLNQAFQKTYNGGQWDAFVTKMESNLSALNYSTYLGGLYNEKAYGIAVDNMGRAYVTGYTTSENFPITTCTIQPTKGLGYLVPDAFVTEVNETGTGLIFSTYLGGTYNDEGNAIAISNDGLNITVTGYTDSINFPLKNASQPYLAGFPATRFTDAFVTKMVKIPPVANITPNPEKGCSPALISFKDNSTNNPTKWFWEFGDLGANNTSTLQNPTHIYNNNGSIALNFTVNLTAWNCDGSNTTSRNVTICPNLWWNFTANQSAQGCVGANDTLIFTGIYVSGSPISDWWFDFGDNSTPPAHQVNVHTFTNTSNFTVTFWVQSECCNNSSTMVVDIRQKPNVSFSAIPTSGLIPLHVNFFDNSTGRPSNWTWTFGAGQGSSNMQNPDHTYTTKNAYNVKLTACNFCGCNNTTVNKFIKAGVPNLSFVPPTLIVPTNDTTPIELYIEEAEHGLSGYNLTVFWEDSVHGNITAVEFPPWAYNSSFTQLPNYIVQIQAVDMLNQTTPGATNIPLATFNLTGTISTFQSTIGFNVSVNEMDDDSGNPMDTNSIPATITVVRLLPFPGKTLPPTDPFDNQVYWDLNGNGRIDFNDVTVFFQNMQWIRDNQYVPFFDYNKNGLIDFADLILLFQKV